MEPASPRSSALEKVERFSSVLSDPIGAIPVACGCRAATGMMRLDRDWSWLGCCSYVSGGTSNLPLKVQFGPISGEDREGQTMMGCNMMMALI